MAETAANRQWLLAHRPVGAVKPDDFRLEPGPVPTPGEGDVLVRTLYFGYDASQRIWLTENGGYMKPIAIGEPMRCMGIGQVVQSNLPGYAPGDLVEGFLAWQDYTIARADGPMPLRKLPPAPCPVSWNLGIFGVGGLTAYFGVTEGLKVRAGDTVVISAATGATGYVAGVIAKILGAKKVIGIAGGPEKCRWVVEKAGFDACIDYKSDDIGAKLQQLAPEGVNAYFDNVGGPMLETLLYAMAPLGRVLICGAMSTGYADAFKDPGPKNYMLLCTKQLTMQGILLFFHAERIPQAAQQLGQWVAEGRLPVFEHIVEGFENAPRLLPTMFSGKEPGKLLLKVADPQ